MKDFLARFFGKAGGENRTSRRSTLISSMPMRGIGIPMRLQYPLPIFSFPAGMKPNISGVPQVLSFRNCVRRLQTRTSFGCCRIFSAISNWSLPEEALIPLTRGPSLCPVRLRRCSSGWSLAGCQTASRLSFWTA